MNVHCVFRLEETFTKKRNARNLITRNFFVWAYVAIRTLNDFLNCTKIFTAVKLSTQTICFAEYCVVSYTPTRSFCLRAIENLCLLTVVFPVIFSFSLLTANKLCVNCSVSSQKARKQAKQQSLTSENRQTGKRAQIDCSRSCMCQVMNEFHICT